MRAAEIRKTFLDFFAERGHRIVPSSSLVPDDPTLLLTTAGMVQFKPYFSGQKHVPYPRAASVQKCARTTDIERVGLTARHLTFFEMLGNFSFGDYFKSDAIRWAWELSTGPFGLEADRIWVTVYETDDEAFEIWRGEVGLPAERIVRRGFDDNFWWMGVPGPGGPCSELFYDRGPAYGEVEGFQDGDRIMEYYNLVFTQNEVDGEGRVVADLPRRNVDTGLGLERFAAILQGVDGAFETDVLRPILATAERIAGRRYGEDARADVSLRIIAEHARSASFLVGDGVFPSNEGRGYVLRRLLRRAVRHAKILGVDEPVMAPMVASVVETMGEAYPEIASGRAFIEQVAGQEEEGFRATLTKGLTLLDEEVRRATKALPADVAFKLHDTYGFPLDLTVEIAAEAGLTVDRDAFEGLMEEQRDRARKARTGVDALQVKEPAYRAVLAERGATKFLGYERDESDSTLVALVGPSGESLLAAAEGHEVEAVLEATPFYPEGGGQIGDAGLIVMDGAELEVLDTQRVLGELIVHRARVRRGEARAGLQAHAAVDASTRAATMRSHTATHVLHWALRDTLGPHARQAGSRVEPGRLRFDFPHVEAVPTEVLAGVERRVNELLAADDVVRPYETTMDEARSRGALMLFEEKYGDIVRVVEIGDYSVELCGGTHVTHTSRAAPVKVLGEGSIGTGLRRIEALTGLEALEGWRRERLILERMTEMLRAGTVEEAPDRLARALEELKKAEDELRRARGASEREVAKDLATQASRVNGVALLAAAQDGLGVPELQSLAALVRDLAGGPAVVVLVSALKDRASIAAAVTKDLVARGISAKELIREAARAIGGGAGGKDLVATGGGKRPDGVAEALRLAEAAAREAIG